MNKEGKLIIFEGGEGTGKSTQIKLLAEQLKNTDIETVVTKEPGGSSKGKEIRKKLLHGNPTPREELDLFFEDRALHFEELIIPSLSSGKWILSDRCSPSTIAYQHYARGLDLEDIKRGDYEARQGRAFDLIILLDMNPCLALERMKRTTRFDREKPEFHEKVRKGFLEQAKENLEYWMVIDAEKEIDEISKIIWKEIETRFF